MAREVKMGDRLVGDGHPTYIIAEIGINHNGDLEITKRIVDAAVHAGADAVKLQKRTPAVSTPPEQQKQMRRIVMEELGERLRTDVLRFEPGETSDFETAASVL